MKYKMVKQVIFVTLTLLVSLTHGYSQISDACPDNASNPKNNSYQTLDKFLSEDGHETHRKLINLDHLQSSNIELLTGQSQSCFRLNEFKSQDMTYSSNTEYTYYKVSNYYFIVSWMTVNSTKPRNVIIFDDKYDIHGIARR